jgi:hypothetical protein
MLKEQISSKDGPELKGNRYLAAVRITWSSGFERVTTTVRVQD